MPPAPAAPRRALLAATAAAALLSGAPRPALSNPLDALLEGRRRTNAKFLLGPIRLARFYLAEAAKAEPAEARKARGFSGTPHPLHASDADAPHALASTPQLVSKASFDCLAIDAANLQLFTQLGRDVRLRQAPVRCASHDSRDACAVGCRCARTGSSPPASPTAPRRATRPTAPSAPRPAPR